MTRMKKCIVVLVAGAAIGLFFSSYVRPALDILHRKVMLPVVLADREVDPVSVAPRVVHVKDRHRLEVRESAQPFERVGDLLGLVS